MLRVIFNVSKLHAAFFPIKIINLEFHLIWFAHKPTKRQTNNAVTT